MRRENLPDLDALRVYFMRRVEKIVEAHGRKLIGWDEIMDPRLPADAAVMSWRGTEGGIAAARAGHRVVMTPVPSCYLDFPQADPSLEPPAARWGGHGPVTLGDCYAFDPLPPGVDPKLILGGQGSLWTEWVAAPRHAEYMIWPRMIALAEALWSPADGRSWDGFARRLESHFERFDLHGIDIARSAYEPSVRIDTRDRGITRIHLSTEMPGVDLYYSCDGSTPDAYSARYSGPFDLPVGAERLRVAPYRDGKPIGQVLTVPVGRSD
jgi:hexosaminidase